MKTIELTRKELYDIVWSTPVSKLNQQMKLIVIYGLDIFNPKLLYISHK